MNKKDVIITLLVVLNVAQTAAGVTLMREHDKTKERYKQLWRQANYLMGMLKDRDIELTGFDYIAWNELGFFEQHEEN